MQRSFPKGGRYAILCVGLWWSSASGASAATPQFQLRDTDGQIHTTAEWSGYPVVVLFFVTNDCPLTNSYVPEMNRIQKSYPTRGVHCFAVQTDSSKSASVTAAHAKAYEYGFPLLLDPNQILVRLTGATVTPEAAVLSPAGKILYRGRMDNRVVDFGKQRPQATVNDLRDAVDAILEGKPAPVPVTKSIGCAINGNEMRTR